MSVEILLSSLLPSATLPWETLIVVLGKTRVKTKLMWRGGGSWRAIGAYKKFSFDPQYGPKPPGVTSQYYLKTNKNFGVAKIADHSPDQVYRLQFTVRIFYRRPLHILHSHT